MNEKNILPDDVVLDTSTYFGFHFANIGKVFMTDKGIMTKLEVFREHKKAPDYLRNITAGKVKEYKPVDKPGWKDGVIVED